MRNWLFILLFMPFLGFSQDTTHVQKPVPTNPPLSIPKKWSDFLTIRLLTQIRYNRLLETNPKLACEQCDRSWGDHGGIAVRRSMFGFNGYVSDRVFFNVVISNSTTPASLNVLSVKDASIEVALDSKKEFLLRVGQTNIPFGLENMQFPGNHTAIDRTDVINSAIPNEGDAAMLLSYTPSNIKKRLASFNTNKGSGNTNMLSVGVFNGQTSNKAEENNTLHVVGRVTYPFSLGNGQHIETSLQAYSGKFVVTNLTKGVKGINEKFEYDDARVGGTFVFYPNPFGVFAEYNAGTSPEYNPITNTIEQKKLHGGYTILLYKVQLQKQMVVPYIRYQYYEGGKKHELDARHHRVSEWEVGSEWQPLQNFEITAAYLMSDRTFEDGVLKNNRQKGNLLRVQAQVFF
jgi:Phosphate-selective porin O and P